MLIAEELLTLCLDDATGRQTLAGGKLDPALGAALLVELALAERITVRPASHGWRERGRIVVVSSRSTDDTELDRALAACLAGQGRVAKDLISAMSRRRITKGLRGRLLHRLTDAGVLTPRHGTIIGFIPRTTWPARDAGPETEVRRRLRSALVDGLTPSERTTALIGLLLATGHLTKVVDADDHRTVKARAKVLSEGDWAPRAVRQAINEVYAAAT